MHRSLYVVSALCLALLLIVPTLTNPPVSPVLLSGMLIGTSFVLTAFGRALQLLGEIRYRLSAEDQGGIGGRSASA